MSKLSGTKMRGARKSPYDVIDAVIRTMQPWSFFGENQAKMTLRGCKMLQWKTLVTKTQKCRFYSVYRLRTNLIGRRFNSKMKVVHHLALLIYSHQWWMLYMQFYWPYIIACMVTMCEVLYNNNPRLSFVAKWWLFNCPQISVLLYLHLFIMQILYLTL